VFALVVQLGSPSLVWDSAHMTTSEQSATRLVAVDDLGVSQVVVVEKTPHGARAVGISAGKPFAVSN
jgi:hypothetical protein